jgi:hypothetical protein
LNENFEALLLHICFHIIINHLLSKGQLISKANYQAVNSSKKRTNEFIFTTIQRVFVRFLEEIEDTKKTFQNYLTFKNVSKIYSEVQVLNSAPAPTSLFHMIYYHGDENYPCLLGIGLRNTPLKNI